MPSLKHARIRDDAKLVARAIARLRGGFEEAGPGRERRVHPRARSLAHHATRACTGTRAHRRAPQQRVEQEREEDLALEFREEVRRLHAYQVSVGLHHPLGRHAEAPRHRCQLPPRAGHPTVSRLSRENRFVLQPDAPRGGEEQGGEGPGRAGWAGGGRGAGAAEPEDE